jgi:hypothetical protein
MNPDTKPTDHKAGIWWRRWSGSIAFLAIIIFGVIGLVQVGNTASDAEEASIVAVDTAKVANQTAKAVRREGKVREEQFCTLILNGFQDRKNRLRNTEEFLDTPAGKEPTALNIYIREISLPQSRHELVIEKQGIPSICWQYNKKSSGH